MRKDFTGRYVALAFRIMGEFGATIAIPVVVLALLGKSLDAKYGTAPYLRVAGFALAAVMTAVMIGRRAKAYGKEYEALAKEESDAQKTERKGETSEAQKSGEPLSKL